MPKKFWSALKNICIVAIAFSSVDSVGSIVIEKFPFANPWKLHLAIIVPLVLIVGGQIWKMYCGMQRDGDWWADDGHPRRHRG
jgi:hypothetical protein